MITITIPETELYDHEKNEFIIRETIDLRFIFSLVVLDKWEAKYRKRLLDNEDITVEEYCDLFKMMCLDDFDISLIDNDIFGQLMKYIKDTPTATVLPKRKSNKGSTRKQIFTSEIIYAYMSITGIDLEWENRNLNKLLMLINVVNDLQSPPEKMSRQEALEEHRNLILERRKMMEKKMEDKGK